MVLGEEMRFDEPDNVCFGCSPHNERGLQLTFVHVAPNAVETRYAAPDHVCGAPGVVHGGIQAAVLDEAIGFAVHAFHDDHGPRSITGPHVVTVEFDLRYRKPVPSATDLTVRGEVLRVAGRDYLCIGEILNGDGEVLTSATARWRRID